MNSWKPTIRVTSEEVKVLVTDHLRDELLRARLPWCHNQHPRALMTLLEGLSLWSGESVIAAISVDASARGIYEWSLFGELLPSDNALVQIDFVEPRQPRRLRGLGSFRDVLALERLR